VKSLSMMMPVLTSRMMRKTCGTLRITKVARSAQFVHRFTCQYRMQQKMAAKQSRTTALHMSNADISELAKVSRERIEADRMRRLGLTPKTSMGVRYEQGYE
jgi:hypothetical protein